MDENTEPHETGKQDQQISLSDFQNRQQSGPSTSKTQPAKKRSILKRVRKRIRRFLKKFRQINLYDIFKPYAQNIKVFLQMLIGGILTILIILKFIHHFFVLNTLTGYIPKSDWRSYPIAFLHQFVYNLPTLNIVSLALAFSTAIELAYTLFTSGPDEAVEPLITGLAAVILFLISRISTVTLDNAGGIALLILALIGLFLLRYLFIEEGIHLLRVRVADKISRSKLSDSNNIPSQTPLTAKTDTTSPTSSNPTES